MQATVHKHHNKRPLRPQVNLKLAQVG
jgi:hypothetical protein